GWHFSAVVCPAHGTGEVGRCQDAWPVGDWAEPGVIGLVEAAAPATTEHRAETRNRIVKRPGRPAPSNAASPAPPKMPRPNRAALIPRASGAASAARR